jgi:hypothetical protein
VNTEIRVRRLRFGYGGLMVAGILSLSSGISCQPTREATASSNSPSSPAGQAAGAVTISVDANADTRPISPLIYGVNFASPEQLRLLNSPINRNGGNATTRYNWKQNAHSTGSDWFFMSVADKGTAPSAAVDTWIRDNQSARAASMVTIPLIGWVAKVGPNRESLGSFSVKKYGPQQKTEQWHTDYGNGTRPDGKPVTGNDPTDANIKVPVAYQKGWIAHLRKTFGPAGKGGVAYYLLDNEPGLWQETHRDVHPNGFKAADLFARSREAAAMVKAIDPTARIAGPEEWGWPSYRLSGYDFHWQKENGWDKTPPEKQANGGQDFVAWYLKQFAAEEKRRGKRLLDVFTLHYYPQADKVSSPDVSEATQKLRVRSTRSLWDPSYKDESWINENVRLIPRMKEWVQTCYPGTKIGITEYSWGAEEHITGALAQADVLGIFGREGVDLATRWVCPKTDSLTFRAMQMFRNYDGRGGAFGDTSVRSMVPDPDTVSAFASRDSKTGALKVMLLNKQSGAEAPVTLALKNVRPHGPVQVYQLTAANKIERLPDLTASGTSVALKLPAYSITLLVVE